MRSQREAMIPLPLADPIWEGVFTVAPLVLVGTREEDGRHDLAPKHMAMPLGWQNHFGFVCHPSHATQRNAERTGVFTVSFPVPTRSSRPRSRRAPAPAGPSPAWMRSRFRRPGWWTASSLKTPISGSSASCRG